MPYLLYLLTWKQYGRKLSDTEYFAMCPDYILMLNQGYKIVFPSSLGDFSDKNEILMNSPYI